MNASHLRERLTKHLLDEIGQVQFPSATMLNRVEAELWSAEALADYAEILVEKVEATRFPSISMLDRIGAVIARLEEAEQREQLQAADGGRAD
jgi:hypothetical protein